MYQQSVKEAFTQGETLTEIDGYEFKTVTLVYLRGRDGAIQPYCLPSEWNETTAQLAARDAEIAHLRARVAQLEKRPVSVNEPTGKHPCSICGAGPFDTRGLGGHMWSVHQIRKTEQDAHKQPSA